MTANFKDYLNIFFILLFSTIFAFFANPILFGFKQIPIFLLIFMSIYFIHWFVFIPSFLIQSEKFFDITGTFAYLFSLLLAAYFGYLEQNIIYVRSITVLLLITIWSTRLGFFLFSRIIKEKEDKRFIKLKSSFSKFFVTWTVSGLWVFITSINGLTVIINNVTYYDDVFYVIGLFIWVFGFIIEVISDEQKKRFKKNENNKNQFICSGLWKISRHPNYFGEMVIWIGIAVISIPTLKGLQYFTLISPVFIIWLLTNISGINLLEEKADLQWGELDSYKKYKKRTPVLIPFIKHFNS